MKMSKDDPLAPKMRALADSGHARAAELRELANKLEAARDGAYAEPQTVTVGAMLGAWARARKLWCEVTGEPLV